MVLGSDTDSSALPLAEGLLRQTATVNTAPAGAVIILKRVQLSSVQFKQDSEGFVVT